MECRRALRQGVFAAYVDFKMSFDSWNHEALGELQRLRGIPPVRIVGARTSLDYLTECCIE